MFFSYKYLFLLLCAYWGLVQTKPLPTTNLGLLREADTQELRRTPRQFDLRLSAEHDDEEDETELALEAIANLWRSSDGNTQVEGSAKVIHRANSLDSGKTRYSATLHLHHDYKLK